MKLCEPRTIPGRLVFDGRWVHPNTTIADIALCASSAQQSVGRRKPDIVSESGPLLGGTEGEK